MRKRDFLIISVISVLLITNLLSFTLSIPAAKAELGFTDDFDSATLKSVWTKIDPEGGSTFDLLANSGWLRITTSSPPGRDLIGSLTNAPRIMMSGVSGNFTIETKVMSTMTKNDEGAGILIWKDDIHYMRLERMSRTIGNPVEQQIIFAVNGGSWAKVTVSSNIDPTYLKLARNGNLFSGYYSSDGNTWTKVDELAFNVADPIDVGLDLINVYHDDTFFADFDYFRVYGSETGKPHEDKTKIQNVIIDKVFVSNQRAEVESVQAIGFHAKWEHDDSDVDGASIWIEGTEHITNETGWVSLDATSSTLGIKTWTANVMDDWGPNTASQYIIWDRIKASYEIETLTPGHIQLIVNLQFEYDNEPVMDAKVKANNVLAEKSPFTKDRGKYKAIIPEWTPFSTINIEISQKGFTPLEARIESYMVGNIVLWSFTSVLTIFITGLSGYRWIHGKKLRQLRYLIEKKEKVAVEEVAEVMSLKPTRAEKLIRELIKKGMVKGVFTSDSKMLILEETLEKEIMRGLDENS